MYDVYSFESVNTGEMVGTEVPVEPSAWQKDVIDGIAVLTFAVAFLGGLVLSKIINWWKW